MRTLAPDHEQHWFDIYGSIAATEDQEQFARIAGNDLKAPLGNMIRVSQLLGRHLASQSPDEDTKEMLQHIIGSGSGLPRSSMTCSVIRWSLNHR